MALRDEKTAAALNTARVFVTGNTPEEFAGVIRVGYAAWGQAIRKTGVKGE